MRGVLRVALAADEGTTGAMGDAVAATTGATGPRGTAMGGEDSGAPQAAERERAMNERTNARMDVAPT
jgi:hypothetical protein